MTIFVDEKSGYESCQPTQLYNWSSRARTQFCFRDEPAEKVSQGHILPPRTSTNKNLLGITDTFEKEQPQGERNFTALPSESPIVFMAAETRKKDASVGWLERCESVETVVIANGRNCVSFAVTSKSSAAKNLSLPTIDGAETLFVSEKPPLRNRSDSKDANTTEYPDTVTDSPATKHRKKHRRNLSFIRLGKSKLQNKEETSLRNIEAKIGSKRQINDTTVMTPNRSLKNTVETAAPNTSQKSIEAKVDDRGSEKPLSPHKKGHFASLAAELKKRFENSAKSSAASKKSDGAAKGNAVKQPLGQKKGSSESIHDELRKKFKAPAASKKSDNATKGTAAKSPLAQKIGISESIHDELRKKFNPPAASNKSDSVAKRTAAKPPLVQQNGGRVSLQDELRKKLEQRRNILEVEKVNDKKEEKKNENQDVRDCAIDNNHKNTGENSESGRLASLAPVLEAPPGKTASQASYPLKRQLTWHGTTPNRSVSKIEPDRENEQNTQPKMNAFVRLVKTRSFTRSPRSPKAPTNNELKHGGDGFNKSSSTPSSGSTAVVKAPLSPKSPRKTTTAPTGAESVKTSGKTKVSLPPKPPKKPVTKPGESDSRSLADASTQSERTATTTSTNRAENPDHSESNPVYGVVGESDKGGLDKDMVDIAVRDDIPSTVAPPSTLAKQKSQMLANSGYKLRRQWTWNGGTWTDVACYEPTKKSKQGARAEPKKDSCVQLAKTRSLGTKHLTTKDNGLKNSSAEQNDENTDVGPNRENAEENPSESSYKDETQNSEKKQTKRKLKSSRKIAPKIFDLVKLLQTKKKFRPSNEDGIPEEQSQEARLATDNTASLASTCPNDEPQRAPPSPRSCTSSPASWESLTLNTLEQPLDNISIDSDILSFNSAAGHQQVFDLFDRRGSCSRWLACGAQPRTAPRLDNYPIKGVKSSDGNLKVEVVKERRNALEKLQDNTAKALETTSGAVSQAYEEISDFHRVNTAYAYEMMNQAREFRKRASERFTITDGKTNEQSPKQTVATGKECHSAFWDLIFCGSADSTTTTVLKTVFSEETGIQV